LADAAARQRRFDVTALGEAMLRFSVRPGDRIQDAPAFDVHVAGSEANVAYALARVGLRSSWVSVLPRNPLGQRVATTLMSCGVDLSNVVWVESGRLGTYFVELSSPPRPTTVTYDRAGSTMSLATPDLFDWPLVCDTRLLHVSGITLGISASARDVAKTAVREARVAGCLTSLDVNYRARVWGLEEAADAMASLAGELDLVICTGEDARDLFGASGRPRDVGGRLQELFRVPAVVLTRGADPAVALLGDESWECTSYTVHIVDRIGAGDAFAAGVLWGFLDGSLQSGLERGVAMSALKMTVHGDLFTLGRESVEDLLGERGREVSR
jgi:2-dehydro-3-deoxygluconokinase